MDERDKDLTHLFVRDLDEIQLPPRGEWRRVPGKGSVAMNASRGLLAAGAVAAVLATALIVGYQLNQRQQNVAAPSASPTPSATASASPITLPGFGPSSAPSASATPGATATAVAGGGIYNDDFGFAMLDQQNRLKFRTESSSTRGPDFSIGGPPVPMAGFAISSDGRQMAYWTQGATEAAGVPQELRIVTVGDPTRSQTLLTLKSNEAGGHIVWSNDASGLAFAVIVLNPQSGPPGSYALSASVHTFDLRGTVAPDRVIYQSQQGGVILQPIAWDRSATPVLAFGETGEGGFMTSYDVTHFTGASDVTTTRAPVPIRMSMSSVQASTDAKFVLGYDLDAQGFSYWPLQSMSGAGHHPAESKYGVNGAIWRPGTHEIGIIGPSNQFWLCDVDKDTSFGCGHTAFSGVPDGAGVRAFRADGSAVVLTVGPVGPATTYLLVRIGADPKATSGDRMTFQDNGGLIASIRFR